MSFSDYLASWIEWEFSVKNHPPPKKKKIHRGKLAQYATARCLVDAVKKDGARISITCKDEQDVPTWYEGQESGSRHGQASGYKGHM